MNYLLAFTKSEIFCILQKFGDTAQQKLDQYLKQKYEEEQAKLKPPAPEPETNPEPEKVEIEEAPAAPAEN